MSRFLAEPVDELAVAYCEAKPFPHVVIDGAFDEPFLRHAMDVWPTSDDSRWRRFACGKSATVKRAIPGRLLDVLDVMNSNQATGWLEGVTGVRGLKGDHELSGGGLHEIAPGGRLQLHVDFNRLRGLYRRLNVLLYLNDRWQDEWGGHLDLRRDPDNDSFKNGNRVVIAPAFNRLVIAESSERSWHGHPKPLACPPGVTRRSLAWYFYTDEPGPGYVNDHSTIYCDRSKPQEQLTDEERQRRKAAKRTKGSKRRKRK